MVPTDYDNPTNSDGNEDFDRESPLDPLDESEDSSQYIDTLPTEDEINNERKRILEQANTTRKRNPIKPIFIMKRCLEVSFVDEDDLRDFCLHFKEVYRRLKDTDRSPFIIRSLITYFDERGETEEFWQHIREIRPHQYNKFHLRWEHACKEYQEWRENQDVMEVLDLAEEHSFEMGFIDPESPASPNPGEQPHPLTSEDPIVINNWFFNNLSLQEQSKVLTVALFEGLNRKHMIPISKEVEQHFARKTSSDT